ncbi:hypothetical protein SAMN05880558_1059 [Aeromonas sp. RU39B]|uniref:hypothetical protein n=1 Tax=Aeromonas sp. RU39B TaxID=1907416 RepID=UPI0009557BF7|nr:hypothetical protein [Aeromonas sp. RU39B]SIQ70179.1 hypothetical protein SAMN05880558_1059 [Aeromonas sp. RU39B]
MKRKKKSKPESSHEVINKILHPRSYIGSKNKAIQDAFIAFIINESSDDDFETQLGVLIKNDVVAEMFNFYKRDIRNYSSKPYFSYKDVDIARITSIYRVLLKSKVKELIEFEEFKRRVYQYTVHAEYESAINQIRQFNEKNSESLWTLSMETLIYGYLKKDPLKFDNIRRKIEELEYSTQKRYFQVASRRHTSSSMTALIENQIKRTNREFIHADAKFLAAVHSLLHLPYPLYDDIDSSYVYYELQQFNYIDFYQLLGESITQAKINHDIRTSQPIIDFNPISSVLLHLQDFITELGLNDCKIKDGAIDKFTEDIIELYNEGQYNIILDQLEDRVFECKNIATNLCIYAKSYVYTNRNPSESLPSLVKDSICNLINIYKLHNVNASTQNLYELAIRIHPLELSKHIILSILKVSPYYFGADDNKKIGLMTLYLYEQATPVNSISGKFSQPFEFSIVKTEPHSHLIEIKNETIEYITNENYNQAAIKLEEYRRESLIYKDYIDLKVFYHLKKQNKRELLNFTARTLIETPQSYICFPLAEIINYIESESLFSVEAVIVAYFYKTHNRRLSKDVFNDIFEEFILSSGHERPSELFESLHIISDMHVFFLEKIATIENIDYLGCFNDNIDLTLERIKIIQGLKVRKLIDDLSFSNEFPQLIESVIIDSGVAKLSTAKIFVDTDSILHSKQSEIELFIETIESKEISKANGNLINLLNLIRGEYINNPEFGLDINLSSEIRHGFFSNIMCSKLKEQNILCELDSDYPNNIKDNEHWINYYDIVQNHILNDINDSLKKFSSTFYKLLEKAENWMKTDVHLNHDRVFCFDIDNYDLFTIAFESLDNNTAPKLIIEMLNDKLESNLHKIQHKLNAELAVEIDVIFSTLLSDINYKKRGTSLNDLIISIQQAQSDVKESIRTVCEWFNLRKDIEFEPLPITDVVRLAQKCFEKISSSDIQFNIYGQGESKGEVKGKDISSLVKALINCFNNSIEHGTNKNLINVKTTSLSENSFKVSIHNNITEVRKDELSSGLLNEIKEKLSAMCSDELLATEGGSGLYKSKYDLMHLSKHYDLTINLNEDVFTVEIFYDDKDTYS